MTANHAPAYELLARNHGIEDLEISIWQIPSPATPRVSRKLRIAGLRGRNFSLAEGSILKMLRHTGISLAPLPGESQKFGLDEECALNLGLLCKVLAPMRSAPRMRQIALGLESMRQPEAAYWLGMAMHRKNPRRVLSALRLLLTE